MSKLTLPDGTPKEQVKWIMSLSLDDLKEFTASQPPCKCTLGGHCLTESLEKLIMEKEHYTYHLHDDCPVCQHLKHHRVGGCYLCEKETPDGRVCR